MRFDELVGLLGKPIRSEEIKAFFQKNGVKYPKKDTISGRAGEYSFWVTDKKLDIDFLFDIDVLNEKYPVEQAERKGVFVPILTNVLFHKKADIDYPFGVSRDLSLEELKAKFGEPKLMSFVGQYNFTPIIDKEKDIELLISFDIEDKRVLNDIWLRIKYELFPVIRFYWFQLGESAETIAQRANYTYDKSRWENKHERDLYREERAVSGTQSDLFWLNWAVRNDYLLFGASEDKEKVKKGEMSIVDFAVKTFAKKSYAASSDFAEEVRRFLKRSQLSLPPHYLKGIEEDLGAFWGKEPQYPRAFRKKAFTAENFKKYGDILDKWLKEFPRLKAEKDGENI